MSTFQVPFAVCPHCHHLATAATSHVGNDGNPPRDGDFSVCIECAAINRYVGEPGRLALRGDLTVDDLADLRATLPATVRIEWRTLAGNLFRVRLTTRERVGQA